jgi:lysyl-tRNA synthetase class 2
MNDTPLTGKQSPDKAVERPWWQREVFAERLPALTVRNQVTRATRQLFSEREFVEVETPAIQLSPGTEPHLTAFETQIFEPFAMDRARPLYLQTSPEFTMKKLLTAGMKKIFQLARVWRNGERSSTHHPEFTMLEWYRVGAGWHDIAEDCEVLIRRVILETQSDEKPITIKWRGMVCDPFADWEYLSVNNAFKKYCGINILATAPQPLKPEPFLLAVEAKRIGVRVDPEDKWDDIFFRIYLDKIEPKLGMGVPTVLYDYPLSMAALARPNPDDGRVAERFEVFVCGLELANGYGELTDPEEQLRRFELDIERKNEITGYSYPIDKDFIDALSAGMPDASGVALGFDRLVMLCTGADKIEDVLWAPVVTE